MMTIRRPTLSSTFEDIPDAGASEYQSLAPLVELSATDLATNEDTVSGMLNFTVTDEDSSAPTVEVTSEDEDLIANDSIFVLKTGPGAYSLFFSPQPDANGTGSLVIAVQDGSNTTYETVKVDVAAVNDAPRFTLPSTRTSILSGSGAQSYPAFVTDISPGADDENQQTLSFSVTNSNNALFTTQPALSPDGTLTFTPSSTYGTVTVTVQASDDGGTALGGANTSAARTFTLTTQPGTQARLGDTVNLDLSWVALASGESLKVIGLPPGLTFTAGPPPRISGRLLGPALAGGSFIQIMNGTKVVRSLPLELVAESHVAAGTYELLLEQAGQPTGKLRITISNPTTTATNPTFTASLDRLGEPKRSVTGSFTATASPQTVRMAFAAVTTFPAVTFDLVITSGSDLVTAATFPTSGQTGRGFRLATVGFISGSAPVTVTFPPALNGDRTSTPGGIGFGKGEVTFTRGLNLGGQLGDAQTFSSGLSVSQTNQAVIWITPYTNTSSYLGGIIDIADIGAAPRAVSAEAAATGLQWRKLADAKSTSYPAGFGPLTLNSNSSRWVSSAKADGVAEALGLDFRGMETFYIAAPSAVLPTRLSLRDSLALIRLAPDNAVPFTGKVTSTTGDFSGTFTLAAPAAATSFTGVLLQDDSFGALIGQGLVKIPITAAVAGSYQTAGIMLFQPSSLGTYRLRIGDTANINLSSLITTGQTLKVSGLPPGLALTGTSITGRVTGLGTATGVQIQVMNGTTVVRTVQLDLAVEPYVIAGSYEVLLQNGGTPTGKLKVTITSPTAAQSKASFTASLERLGETKRSAIGTFTASATSPQDVTIAFPAVTTFPAVTYVLSISGTSHEVTGVTSPESAFIARGFRLARTGHLPAVVPALTMTFPPVTPGNRTTTPGGIGFAKGSISTAGLVALAGTLGDGQPFTASLNLGQTDQAVVCLTPYTNKSSFLGGLITLPATATPDRSSVVASAPSNLKWTRLRDVTALAYPAGFSMDLNTLASRWVPAGDAATLAEFLGLYYRSIHVSYIAPTPNVLPSYLSLRDGLGLLSISPSNAVPFTVGKVVGTDGTFSGTLTLQAPAQVSAMSGIFLQDPTTGFTIGQGMVKVPIAAALKGSFQTMGVQLGN